MPHRPHTGTNEKSSVQKELREKGKTEVTVLSENRKNKLAPVNFVCSSLWLFATGGLSDIQSK